MGQMGIEVEVVKFQSKYAVSSQLGVPFESGKAQQVGAIPVNQ